MMYLGTITRAHVDAAKQDARLHAAKIVALGIRLAQSQDETERAILADSIAFHTRREVAARTWANGAR